ncbi:hypothetical protein F975_00828 [Acinetobacter sp. ANC 3789]|uniref:EpsG family protein n=1 Tax=Acinetobacter sp. ANC 3789 TaxID=1217714 RepID=UPI0002CE07F6|nr:EpsG family protein [Acinetobacter sp. ANC 3789]ENU80970.1 hypothetical protein F975_00828 [Acinetobacter sp. ANC 3789]
MIPYLFILLFVMVWVIFEKYSLNRRAFWIPTLALSLFAGIRSYRVGTDTGAYVSNYISNLNPSYFQFRDDVEKGYQLFDYLLLNITHNYFWLLFLTAFFIVFSYLRFIKKYSQDYVLSVIIFVTFGAYTFMLNGLRQAIAMAIFLYAIPALINKKLLQYVLICLFASLFHISALIMIPFYFLVNVNIKNIYKIMTVLVVAFIGASPIIKYMAKDNARYEGYTTNDDFSGLFTLGLYVVVALFVLVVNVKLKIKDELFNKLLTLYLLGIALLIPVSLLGAGASGPQRILNYFTWTLMLIFPILINKFKGFSVKLFFIILCVVYYYLATSKFSNLSPYMINSTFEIF